MDLVSEAGEIHAIVGEYGAAQIDADQAAHRRPRALKWRSVLGRPHGEQLLFASLGGIEEQDVAVLKFNDVLRELLR